MDYIQSFCSDIGRKRKTNQDSLAILKAETAYGDILLAVMCDGMGGHSEGELASKFCVTEMAEWFRKAFPDILYAEVGPIALKNDWKHLMEDVNHLLFQYGEKYHSQLGSTMTAALFWDGQYFCVHVGDSRMYEISDDVLQITRDHSWIEQEIARGSMTREEAEHDKRRNILLECMGITDTVSMDFYTGEILPDTVYLLCTDGFWHCQKEEELQQLFRGEKIQSNKDLQEILEDLVDAALDRGEKDNISVIGVVPKADKEASDGL